MAGKSDFSAVPQDFYQKVNEAMSEIVSEVERETLAINVEALMLMRLPKIARTAATSKLTEDISKKLAQEEVDLFMKINAASTSMKLEVLK